MADVFCYISNKIIPPARVEALKEMGIPESRMTVIEHSTVQKKKGFFTGETGVSDFLIVDQLYDGGVRSVFKESRTIRSSD